MLIGIINDIHYNTGWSSEKINVVRSCINHLLNVKNVDILVLLGDQTATDPTYQNDPEEAKSQVEGFWDDLFSGFDLSRVFSVPGNHDSPPELWYQFSADKARHLCPFHINEGVVDVFLLCTHPPGYLYGYTGEYSYTQSRGLIIGKDLLWLERKLKESKVKGHIKIIFTHHAIYRGGFYQIDGWDGLITGASFYNVILNVIDTEKVLKDNAPVISCIGHIWPPSASYKQNYGVYRVWKEHFHYTDHFTTIAYMDVDETSGNVKYYTIPSDLSSETLIMDVTPSW